MINKLRIWLAYRRFQAAKRRYEKNRNLANLGRMAKANNSWYFLKHPDCIRPAW